MEGVCNDAIRADDPACLEDAIARSCFGVDDTFGGKNTVLHRASAEGAQGCVDMLLARSADVTRRTRIGSTPLHLAAHKGHDGCVRSLLAYGADPQPNCNGLGSKTPLHLAAKGNHCKTAALLLRSGALDTMDPRGATALKMAAEQGYTDMVALLLSHGADGSDGEALKAAVSGTPDGSPCVALLVQTSFERGGPIARQMFSSCILKNRPGHFRTLLLAGCYPEWDLSNANDLRDMHVFKQLEKEVFGSSQSGGRACPQTLQYRGSSPSCAM